MAIPMLLCLSSDHAEHGYRFGVSAETMVSWPDEQRVKRFTRALNEVRAGL
jgi:hypothetical protein